MDAANGFPGLLHTSGTPRGGVLDTAGGKENGGAGPKEIVASNKLGEGLVQKGEFATNLEISSRESPGEGAREGGSLQLPNKFWSVVFSLDELGEVCAPGGW